MPVARTWSSAHEATTPFLKRFGNLNARFMGIEAISARTCG